MSVSIVARRYDINTNQLFTRRQKYFRGELGDIGVRGRPADFVPVTVVDQAVAETKQLPAPLPVTKGMAVRPEHRSRPGKIELELKNGIRLKLRGEVNAASLQQVLSVLREVP
jgi:transposase